MRTLTVASTRAMGLGALLTILVAGCSSGGSSTKTTAVGANAGRSQTGSARVTVRSTLDGHTTLPLRIHWVATPSVSADHISEVDFLIDGKLGWVEHNAPYYYGDDGNWLVTSFLTPGEHTFTTRATTIQGQAVTDTVKASVSPPPAPPATLSGTWSRVVTAADISKASSSQPPPPGRWKLRIVSTGWRMRDPTPGGSWGLFDVAYRAGRKLQMRPTIEYPPYPNSNNGGFCEDTDPLASWAYRIARDGKTLTLRPTATDTCGDRTAILAGTWRRT